MMKMNNVTQVIIDSAVEVHRVLGGPGLLEGVYEEALVWELKQRKMNVARQVQLPITYKGQSIGNPLRIDVMVNGIVLVECKMTIHDDKIFQSQLLTYLRLTGLRLGLLLNFGRRLMKDGIHRIINGY
jgi:GxxExxY protein